MTDLEGINLKVESHFSIPNATVTLLKVDSFKADLGIERYGDI